MRKWMTGLLAALLLLSIAAFSLADSEGVIVQSSCSVVPSGDYHLVYCYAQIHNNSDKNICLEQGVFELRSGDMVIASQDVTQIWPSMIAPGEDGFVFDVVAFEPDENGQPVVPQVTGLEYIIQYMTVEEEFSSLDLAVSSEIERDARGGMSVVCTVTNETDMEAWNPTIAFGLYTDGGAMVYADGITLNNVAVPAGETMRMRFDVDDEISGQWSTYGANVTDVRALGSFRDGTD